MIPTHECIGRRSFDGELSNQRIIVKLFRSISAAASSLHICCCLYKLYTHKLCQTSPHHRPSCCHNRSSHSHFNNNVAESNLICRFIYLFIYCFYNHRDKLLYCSLSSLEHNKLCLFFLIFSFSLHYQHLTIFACELL